MDRPFPDGNRILRLHDLILAHLPGRTLFEALTTCVKQLATEFGCLGISVDLPVTPLEGAQHGSTQAALQSAGFRISGDISGADTRSRLRTRTAACCAGVIVGMFSRV